MILYRICREKYAYDLSGRGGLLTAARWHDHLPVIYAAVNSSTAILEKLVHLNTDEIHNDLVTVTLVIPDEVSAEKIEIAQLPTNWANYPAPTILQRIGNTWLRSNNALLLHIPSAIDPLATNVLINPLHPEASQIVIGEVRPFRFDRRLMKKNKD